MPAALLILLALGGELIAAPAPRDPPAVRAQTERQPPRQLRLVLLPGRAGLKKLVQVTELRRLLGLLLKPSAVKVTIGPPMTEASFPAQVWRARAIGKQQHAMAVVWFRSLTRPGTGKEAELFLHLVDRVTNKALIKTLRLRGRVGFDLHQQVALKLWTLLRASLLELQGTRRGQTPAIARIIAPRTAGQPGPVLHKKHSPPPSQPPRVQLRLGYLAGVFASGVAWHHGAWLAADVLLKRFSGPSLTLALGASVELLWPVELQSSGVDLRLDLIPACLGLALGWRRGSFTLEGRLRGGALIQKAAATLPGADGRTFWRGNPLVGTSVSVGWQPLRRLTLELRGTVDGLLRGQCFETAASEALCVDRARFSLGIGLRLALP